MNEPQSYVAIMALGGIIGLLFVIVAKLNAIIEALL